MMDAARRYLENDDHDARHDHERALEDACKDLTATILCILAQKNLYAYAEKPIGKAAGRWNGGRQEPDDETVSLVP